MMSKKITFVFIGVLLSLVGVNVANAWYNDTWNYRSNITFDNSAQNENLVDFPLLVVLNSSVINYTNIKSDGTDIRFVDSDDLTELNYHIELFNSSGNSYLWVKVPQIDASSSTDFIHMYYGNDLAIDVQDEYGTYDQNYISVFHLDKFDVSDDNQGSTQYDIDGNLNNGLTTPNVTGKIGYCVNLTGSTDYINTGGHSEYNMGAGNWTYEVWVKTTDTGGQIVEKAWGTTGGVVMRLDTGNIQGRFKTSGGTDYGQSGDAVNDDVWNYVVFTKDGNTLDTMSNGNIDGSVTNSIIGTSSSSQSEICIGDKLNQLPAGQIDAYIDEVRVSNVTRNITWVKASYLSGLNSFNTFSLEEKSGVEPPPKADTNIELFLNGTQGNRYYPNESYANFTTILNISGLVNLETNITGFIDQLNKVSPYENITQLTCESNNTYYNITGYFEENSTTLGSSETHYAICYFPTTTTTTIPFNFTFTEIKKTSCENDIYLVENTTTWNGTQYLSVYNSTVCEYNCSSYLGKPRCNQEPFVNWLLFIIILVGVSLILKFIILKNIFD